ncbi:MAG: AsmA-like C-terminal region-containing protein [Sphingomonadales bacterium]
MVVNSLRIGETHFAATVTRDPSSEYMIAITAESFDARPFITKTFKGVGTEGNYTMPAFRLDVNAARVVGLNDVELRNLDVTADYRDNRWISAGVTGALTGGGTLRFELLSPPFADDPRSPDTRRRFSLTSNDAGEIARALDLFENAIGGALSFTGRLRDPALGSGLEDDDEQATSGTVRVDHFRVVTAPTLSRILSAGSMPGIRDLLGGDGIGFERLDVPYAFRDSVITLDRARAWGPAIGLTMSGALDVRRNRANLEGSVVPAYTANSILGRIPVLGSLLVGGEGQGLFAINYRVTGTIEEPSVSVNPLSMLTPGFLRGIFGVLDSGGTDTDPE